MTALDDRDWVVEASDLHFSYPEQKKRQRQTNKKEPRKAPREALSGLTFKIRKGSITGLLGPNGSGKSTCFKLITSQIKSQKGTLKVLGLDLKENQKTLRNKMGVCFQSPSLDPILTIYENLQIQASLYLEQLNGDPKKYIDHVLELLALKDRAHERVSTLSGGLARRVELAKTLLHKPQLIVLDEPTAGVDPLLRREFWKELEALRDQGVSVLVSTHLMDEAELCDELLFLSEGRLVASGTTGQLKKEYGFEIIKAEFLLSLGEMDDLEKQLRSCLRDKETLIRSQTKISVECFEPFQWLDRLRNLGEGRVTHLEWSKPSLADIYFAKTGKSLV